MSNKLIKNLETCHLKYDSSISENEFEELEKLWLLCSLPSDGDVDTKWQTFRHTISKKRKTKSSIILFSASIAAVFAIVLCCSIFLRTETTHKFDKDILLTIEDNKPMSIDDILLQQYELSEIQSISQSGMTLTLNNEPREIRNYKIEVPRTKQFHINMADGSEVWINSESEFYYPGIFNKDKRRVKLKGEAYFSIAKDTMRPFIIDVNAVTIEVLGTEFNIKSYTMEQNMTTVIEGCVKIHHKDTSYILTKNKCAELNSDSILIYSNTNQNVYAWREGILYFDNCPLENVLNELHRHYDFEYLIENSTTSQLKINAKFFKEENIDVIFDVLRRTELLDIEFEAPYYKIKMRNN